MTRKRISSTQQDRELILRVYERLPQAAMKVSDMRVVTRMSDVQVKRSLEALVESGELVCVMEPSPLTEESVLWGTGLRPNTRYYMRPARLVELVQLRRERVECRREAERIALERNKWLVEGIYRRLLQERGLAPKKED